MILTISSVNGNFSEITIYYRCGNCLADGWNECPICLDIENGTWLTQVSNERNQELIELRIWKNNSCDIVPENEEEEY